eukprot:Skav234158  [mRNA]  locus=scaffold572:6997:11326:+ [translate_table: standard]
MGTSLSLMNFKWNLVSLDLKLAELLVSTELPHSPRASEANLSVQCGSVTSTVRSAVQEDVTQAFRRLARKRHPDKGGSKEEFQRLRAVPWEHLVDGAYELLTSGGIPDAPSPVPSPQMSAMAWEAQRLSAQERAARQAQAAQRAEMTAPQRAKEEPRAAAPGGMGTWASWSLERRHAEEWEELRPGMRQRADCAHISGVSYDMQDALQRGRAELVSGACYGLQWLMS